MKIILKGHDYKYAVEQMLLTLFPEERPVYEGDEESKVTLSLNRGNVWLTASAVLHWNGKITRHSCRAKISELNGEALNDGRVSQRILKLAFYRAGVEALGKEPPWGAMTGVRPVKIPTKAMLAGATTAQAKAVLRKQYRMIGFECLSYGNKALLWGLPLSLAINYGIQMIGSNVANDGYVFPFGTVAIAVVSVFLIVFVTMFYAVNKLRRDNPIDAIRMENT